MSLVTGIKTHPNSVRPYLTLITSAKPVYNKGHRHSSWGRGLQHLLSGDTVPPWLMQQQKVWQQFLTCLLLHSKSAKEKVCLSWQLRQNCHSGLSLTGSLCSGRVVTVARRCDQCPPGPMALPSPGTHRSRVEERWLSQTQIRNHYQRCWITKWFIATKENLKSVQENIMHRSSYSMDAYLPTIGFSLFAFCSFPVLLRYDWLTVNLTYWKWKLMSFYIFYAHKTIITIKIRKGSATPESFPVPCTTLICFCRCRLLCIF